MSEKRRRFWLVRISVVGCIIVSLLALWAWNSKVEQLDRAQKQLAFITGEKTAKTCASAKTNKALWSKMSAVVIARVPQDDPASPQARALEAEVAKYVAAQSPSCLKGP